MKRNFFNSFLAGFLVFLMVLTSHAGGKLLGANVEVTDNGLGDLVDAKHPDVAANGSTLYAVWEDYRDTWDEAEIYLAKSTDGGATWGTNVNVSNGLDNGIGLDDPAVAVYPDNWVYIVWFNPYPGYEVNPRVYMAYSSDGTSFSRFNLWQSNDEDYYIEPDIAVDPDSRDMVVVVSDWVGSGPGGENIYGLVWDYGASQWRYQVTNDVTGSADSSGGFMDGSRLAAAAGGGVSCVAWEDARDGTMRVYGDCSTDHGQTWGSDFAISPTGVEAGWPGLALAPDGSLYAAYEADGQLYVRRSTNRGGTWSTPVQVSSIPQGDELGRWDLAVDGNGTVAVLWAEGYWGTFGASNLYLSTSTDDGQTFTHLQVEDADDAYFQYSPAIAAYGSDDEARAVMVWSDDRNIHEEIWSARAELDATPPTAPTNLQATPGDTVVDLTWTAASDANGVSGYYVIRAASSGGTYSVLNPHIVTGTSYRDVGLDGATYYYKVFAVDGTGNVGPASDEASAAATVGTDLPLYGTIAYETGSDVRLRDLPSLGNDRVLSQGWAPLFAPDGVRVYYRSGPTVGGSIVSRKTDGSDLQTYFSHNKLYGAFDIAADDIGYFAWIQEQQYTQIDPFESWDTYEPHYGTAGSTQYVDTHEFAESPTLSAGRQWLAYTSLGYHAPNLAVHQYDHVALCLADLSSNTRLALYQDTNYQDPAFAPSDSALAFAADFSGQYEIWKAQVQTDGSLANLTQLTRGGDGLWSRAPAWSSDGNWLIFQRDVNASATVTETRLFVVRADGSSLRALNIAGEEPTWYGGGAAAADHRVFLPLVTRNR